MPTPEEKVSRILDRIEGRVTRLEEDSFQEGVPNPLVSFAETSTASDSVSVTSQPSGSAQWNSSSWNASEYSE